jgi:3-methyladenine DNA glycosylase/8-oxoguanine DNA glycosylase
VRTFDVPLEIELLRSLRPLVHSAQDPTIRLRTGEVARACRTPEGPATVHVRRVGPRRFEARGYGPGADWLVTHAPALVGADDDLSGFEPSRHPLVARAHHRRPHLRLVRTGVAWDLLVPTILAQRVTSVEAARSWTRLCRRHGEPAPGPFDLHLHPSPEVVAALPDWTWHRLGVDRARATAARSAARYAGHLERCLGLPAADRLAAVTKVPGVGVWTAGLVLRGAAGDPDAVEVGDFHVKNQVAFNLAGEPRATDERMLELLAPFAGHRGRVVRLVLSIGRRPPAFGPKPKVIPVDRL